MKRRFQFNWNELYIELATLSVSRIELYPCIRPQGIQVDPRVGRDHIRRRLVDVGLALQVQAAAAYVRQGEDGFPWQLPLHGEIPRPSFRILEGLALRGYCQGETIGGSSSGLSMLPNDTLAVCDI